MTHVLKSKSPKAEREFWDTHDAIETFGERGWKVSEPGTTEVTSVYVTKVGSRGALVRIPNAWLAAIGARRGRKIKASVKGKRLVMELV